MRISLVVDCRNRVETRGIFFLLIAVALLVPFSPRPLVASWTEAGAEAAGVEAGETGSAPSGLFSAQTFTLENGLQVVAIPNRRAPVVVHMVWYKVGSADEVAGNSGLAHFLEHLMFKGTDTLSPGEFSAIVARAGGSENAFTSHDYTAYFQQVSRENLELVMKLEADRMANLRLEEEAVASERAVVLEERRSRTDNDPFAQLSEQVASLLYYNHPYRRPIIGWGAEISSLTTKGAIDFYRRHYSPSNAVLVVAGDIDAAELRPLAEKYYGGIPGREMASRQRPQEPALAAPRRVTMTSPHAGLGHVLRAYRMPFAAKNDDERPLVLALEVLAEILGGGPTGRLYQALAVKEGVAASVSVYYDGSSLDPSPFWVSLTPRPDGDLAALEEALDREIAALHVHGVDEAETRRAVERLLASAVYARDSLFAMARVMGTALTGGQSVEDVETWPQAIQTITAADVNRAFSLAFSGKRSVTGLLLPEDEEAEAND